MKRLLLAACLAAILPAIGGCQSGPAPAPVIQTKIVEVPVPAPCPAMVGPDPVYPDTDEALGSISDIFQGAQLLKAGRTLRVAREAELKGALTVCQEGK